MELYWQAKDREQPTRNAWQTNDLRTYADWDEAPIDGWPLSKGYQLIYKARHVKGVEKGKVYTDDEERELHARQDGYG